MGKRLGTRQAAAYVGLSEYALRLGTKQGRYPCFRTGGHWGRFIYDVDLLEEAMRQEALANIAPAAGTSILPFGKMRRIPE